MVLTKKAIANEIKDVLGFPSWKEGESYRTISIILRVIVQALYDGERVQIEGFGTFFVRKRKALNKRVYWSRRLLKIPAKFHVVFQPSPSLLRYINQ